MWRRLFDFIPSKRELSYSNDKEIKRSLLVTFFFIIYMICATIVCFNGHDEYSYYYNSRTAKLFQETHYMLTPYTRIEWSMITTVNDFWNYVEYNFLLTMFNVLRRPYVYYAEDNPFATNRVFRSENTLLGPVRIRQVRLQAQPCEAKHSFVPYRFKSCYHAYSRKHEQTDKYFKGTEYYYEGNEKAFGLRGEEGYYYGGGYVKDLTFEFDSSREVIRDLKANKWIDRGTRLIVIEYKTYNENVAAFGQVRLIFEFLPTGTILSSMKTHTMHYHSIFDFEVNSIFLSCAVVLYYIMVLFYICVEIKQFAEAGWKRYLMRFRNTTDLLILVLTFFCLGYNIWHRSIVAELQKEILDSQATKYVNFDTFSSFHEDYLSVNGLQLFFIYLRLLEFLTFIDFVRRITRTLFNSILDLLGYAIIFVVIILSFSLFCIIVFGSLDSDFRNWGAALASITSLIFNNVTFKWMHSANFFWTPIFYCAYIFVIYLFLMEMFVSIVLEAYLSLKYEKHPSHLLTFIKYRIQRFCYFLRHCRCMPVPKVADDSEPTETGEKIELDEATFTDKTPTNSEEYLVNADEPNFLDEHLKMMSRRVEMLHLQTNKFIKTMEKIVKIIDRRG